MNEKRQQLKEWIGGSDNIMFFGGAGVFTEDGIPDLRSVDGLCNQQYKYPPETIISRSFYMRYPEELYRFYGDKMPSTDAVPNQAHKALARLEERRKLKVVITRDAGGLHQMAGSREVPELHGSIHRDHCIRYGQFYDLDYVVKSDGVSHCSCGGVIKPDVVLYEEGLGDRTLRKSMDYIRHADIFIIGRIFLVVYPAARLIDYYRGHKLVLINKAAASRGSQTDLIIGDPIGEVLETAVDQERKISQMYQAAESRYGSMEYEHSGRSGILLPRISLGLWQNFELEKSLEEQKTVLFRAFDMSITHFDLANNYGFPAVGKTEGNFNSALRDGLGRYRNELLISTKAGFNFWPGSYDSWESREYLVASLGSSLKHMGLEYVDVFCHHRPDSEIPLEETVGTLSSAARQGKALYVGISNYQAEEAEAAIHILRENKAPCLLHQPWYNMFERWAEDGLFEFLDREGVGCICYSPLARGALTGRYLDGILEGSRASKEGTTVGGRYLTEDKLVKIGALNKMTGERRQPLAQMTLAWVLRRKEVTSVLIGASSTAQLEDNAKVLNSPAFSCEELAGIEGILRG